MKNLHCRSLFAVYFCLASSVAFAEQLPKVIFYQKIDGVDKSGLSEFVCLALEAKLSGSAGFTMLNRESLADSLEETERRELQSGSVQALLNIAGGEIAIYPKVAHFGQNIAMSFRVVDLRDSSYQAVTVSGTIDSDPMVLVEEAAGLLSGAIQQVSKHRPSEAVSAEKRVEVSLPRVTLAMRVPEASTTAEAEALNPDPAADKELTRIAIENGFEVISLSRPSQSVVASELLHLEGREYERLFREARNKGVEVLVIGSAVSDSATRLGAYRTAKARVEFNAIKVDTAEVIATAASYGVATDLSDFVAQKKAIEDATQRIAIQFYSEIAKAP